jgi:hypothetical protein
MTKAIQGSHDHDEQFQTLIGEGRSVPDAYWEVVIDGMTQALRVLAHVLAALDAKARPQAVA